MLSRFPVIPERYGQTDGRTDRIAISISRVSMLTRDKNVKLWPFLRRDAMPSADYALARCPSVRLSVTRQ